MLFKFIILLEYRNKSNFIEQELKFNLKFYQ